MQCPQQLPRGDQGTSEIGSPMRHEKFIQNTGCLKKSHYVVFEPSVSLPRLINSSDCASHTPHGGTGRCHPGLVKEAALAPLCEVSVYNLKLSATKG